MFCFVWTTIKNTQHFFKFDYLCQRQVNNEIKVHDNDAGLQSWTECRDSTVDSVTTKLARVTTMLLWYDTFRPNFFECMFSGSCFKTNGHFLIRYPMCWKQYSIKYWRPSKQPSSEFIRQSLSSNGFHNPSNHFSWSHRCINTNAANNVLFRSLCLVKNIEWIRAHRLDCCSDCTGICNVTIWTWECVNDRVSTPQFLTFILIRSDVLSATMPRWRTYLQKLKYVIGAPWGIAHGWICMARAAVYQLDTALLATSLHNI